MALPLFVSALGCQGLQAHRFRAGLPKIRDYRAGRNITKYKSHATKLPRAKIGFDSVFLPVGKGIPPQS